MYKNIAIIAILVYTAISLGSCKKENKDSRDYTPLFKNTVWTGTFHYTSKTSEPMSIAFNENGQFTWYEMAGDFPGTWKIENGKLSLTFSGGGVFTAKISADNKLINLQNLSGNEHLPDNAGLNTIDEPQLINTFWYSGIISINFSSNSSLTYNGSSMGSGSATYVRHAKSIRFTTDQAPYFNVFAVFNGNTTADGVCIRLMPNQTNQLFQLTR